MTDPPPSKVVRTHFESKMIPPGPTATIPTLDSSANAHNKTMRSQRIAVVTSPNNGLQNNDRTSIDPNDSAPPGSSPPIFPPRSHTPGHLANMAQRKRSDSSLHSKATQASGTLSRKAQANSIVNHSSMSRLAQHSTTGSDNESQGTTGRASGKRDSTATDGSRDTISTTAAPLGGGGGGGGGVGVGVGGGVSGSDPGGVVDGAHHVAQLLIRQPQGQVPLPSSKQQQPSQTHMKASHSSLRQQAHAEARRAAEARPSSTNSGSAHSRRAGHISSNTLPGRVSENGVPPLQGVPSSGHRRTHHSHHGPHGPHHSSSHGGHHVRKGHYLAFPSIQDPRHAPEVVPAPTSGMYWYRAPVSGAGHTALRAHTVTMIGSNVYVFGGCDSKACFNELYVLDADSFHWSTPHVVGEIPVPLRAMTCTAVGKKLVIFGGGDGPAYYNDVYVLDTTNFRWSKPRIHGDRQPSKRRAHTACLYKNGIYIFGGGDGVQALNDIWRLDVTDTNKMSWKLVSGPGVGTSVGGVGAGGGSDTAATDVDGVTAATTVAGAATATATTTATTVAAAGAGGAGSGGNSIGTGPRPKARGYHTANVVGSKLIIFGGSDGGECFNDVWVYDVETSRWSAVSIPVTHRRLSHSATIVGSYLFVIGGHDGNEYSNDVLLLNLVTMTWDRRKVYGQLPSGRGYHGAVLYDSRILVIGGFDGTEVFRDVWILELAVHSYYSQISHFTIEV